MSHNQNQQRPLPLLALTLGDTNGIGPEILVKALASSFWKSLCVPVVFGDRHLLESVAQHVPDAPAFYEIAGLEDLHDTAALPVYAAGCVAPPLHPGTLDPEASRCAAVWIETAARWACAGRIQGMVTCPVTKEGILLAGCPYPGHTPLLQAISGVPQCHMSLFSDRMRVVHITAHLSMRDAVNAVRKETVIAAIEAGADVLKRLKVANPHIGVAGLNPHAGEAGAFGLEEQEEIAPAIADALACGIKCSGPHAPDTVFHRMYQGEFDLVVAMYHDQGHIPFKLVAMDEGVHATLGLPFIRTSPDHGTAFDIAGTGLAREHSLCAAITLAANWAQSS